MTEKELLTQLLELHGEVLDDSADKEEVADMFVELSNVDGLVEYLRYTMNQDIKRYFSAAETNSNERSHIKGGYLRTAYLKQRIIMASDKKATKKSLSQPKNTGIA